jgi:DNA replication and repair protein RecF
LIVKNLKIRGFRNQIESNFIFNEAKNLIYGLNGAGKTSILEAIFILGFGKSFLNVKKSDIINHSSLEFELNMNIKNMYGENDLMGIFSENKFSLFLNNKKLNIFEINKYFYPVYFSSSNFNLYIDSKLYLRRLINNYIFGVNSLYIHYILSYNKALRQKNHLLKTKYNLLEISSWNKIISELSLKIVNIRKEFIKKLNFKIRENFYNDLFIEYEPSFKDNIEHSEDYFFEKLEDLKEFEINYKKSLIGPHLDVFNIVFKGKNLKFYSSGEKKIGLLMIYISFIKFFKDIRNEYPVFLVDDFDTTIDNKNVDFLLNNYPEMQVIATSVNENLRFDRTIEIKKEN